MTFKTLFIAVALVLGFAGFMTAVWSVSSWMIGPPADTVEPAPGTVPSTDNTGAASPDQNETAKTEPVQDTKVDQNRPVESGVYDDSWSGSEQPNSAVGLKPVVPFSDDEAADTDPFSPDDREATEEPGGAGSPLPSSKNNDPYSGDDREKKIV